MNDTRTVENSVLMNGKNWTQGGIEDLIPSASHDKDPNIPKFLVPAGFCNIEFVALEPTEFVVISDGLFSRKTHSFYSNENVIAKGVQVVLDHYLESEGKHLSRLVSGLSAEGGIQMSGNMYIIKAVDPGFQKDTREEYITANGIHHLVPEAENLNDSVILKYFAPEGQSHLEILSTNPKEGHVMIELRTESKREYQGSIQLPNWQEHREVGPLMVMQEFLCRQGISFSDVIYGLSERGNPQIKGNAYARIHCNSNGI